MSNIQNMSNIQLNIKEENYSLDDDKYYTVTLIINNHTIEFILDRVDRKRTYTGDNKFELWIFSENGPQSNIIVKLENHIIKLQFYGDVGDVKFREPITEEDELKLVKNMKILNQFIKETERAPNVPIDSIFEAIKLMTGI